MHVWLVVSSALAKVAAARNFEPAGEVPVYATAIRSPVGLPFGTLEEIFGRHPRIYMVTPDKLCMCPPTGA